MCVYIFTKLGGMGGLCSGRSCGIGGMMCFKVSSFGGKFTEVN